MYNMYYRHRYNFIKIMFHHFHLIFNQIELNYGKILMKINNDVLSLSFLHIHLLEKVLDKQHITNRLTKNHFNKSILINEIENYKSQ